MALIYFQETLVLSVWYIRERLILDRGFNVAGWKFGSLNRFRVTEVGLL